MEDTYCAKDKLCNDINTGVFGVFDGHGGKQVATHISERIPEELKKEMIKNHSGDLS
jgi:serine/threonine protein phosphatase PrpC